MEKLFEIKTKYDVKKIYPVLMKWCLDNINFSKTGRVKKIILIILEIIILFIIGYLSYIELKYNLNEFITSIYLLVFCALSPFIIFILMVTITFLRITKTNKKVDFTITEVYDDHILIYLNNREEVAKIPANDIVNFVVGKKIYFFTTKYISMFCDKDGFVLGKAEDFEKFMNIKVNDL